MSTYRSNQDTAFCCNRGDHPGHTEARMTTYEEWRVTGTPKRRRTEWVFPGEMYDDPEAEARRYISNAVIGTGWTDGPHLHKRTVTVSEWTGVEA